MFYLNVDVLKQTNHALCFYIAFLVRKRRLHRKKKSSGEKNMSFNLGPTPRG